MDNASTTTTKRRRWLPRFSLRTLLLSSLLIGSGTTLWWHWEPWQNQWTSECLPHAIWNTAFSSDNQYIQSTCESCTWVWSIRTGERLCGISPPQGSGFFNTVMSPDPTRILTISRRGEARLSVLPTGLQVLDFVEQLEYHPPPVFSSDSKRIVAINKDGVGCTWDAETGTLIQKWQSLAVSPMDNFNQLLLANDDKHVFVSKSGLACIYDSITGKCEKTLNDVDWYNVKVAIFNPSNWKEILILADMHDTAQLWNWPDSRMLHSFPSEGMLRAMAFSADGKIVTISDKSFSVWDLKSNRPKMTINGDFHKTTLLSIPTDFCRAIIASNDTTVQIRDLGTGAVLNTLGVSTLPRSRGYHNCASATANGQFIATASEDHRVTVWSRRRPEYWWGLAWLPEFWLTLVVSAAFAWSAWRERTAI